MTELRVEYPLPTPASLAGLINADEEESIWEQEQDPDWERYVDAAFMALDHEPMTPEAKSLCRDLANQIGEWERCERKRTNERRGKLEEFRRAVGLVVSDLLAVPDNRPRRWLFRPMGKEEFTGEAVSYRTFRAIFDALQALALTEVQPGYFYHAEGECQYGRCTRMRASPVLLELVEQHGIDLKEARRHFRRLLPTDPLVLRASSKRNGHRKIYGRRMRIQPTERSRALAAEVREINEFLGKHHLQNGDHHGYRRIFNCGDDPGFDWNKGGRLYSQGESYQQLSKDQRLKMLIDGEPVVEIDVRASFLTILHALKGQPLSRDPYEVPGLPRKVVKNWVTMTLGHHQFHRRWPPEICKEHLDKHGTKLAKAYPIRKVQEAALKALPVLEDWPKQDLTCFDLMYLESEAVIRSLLRLKRERDVVCLSVHDSIIVPASQEALAVAILREEYRRGVGVEPALKVSRADGSVATIAAATSDDPVNATGWTIQGDDRALGTAMQTFRGPGASPGRLASHTRPDRKANTELRTDPRVSVPVLK